MPRYLGLRLQNKTIYEMSQTPKPVAKEIWREIPWAGFRNQYFVSDFGNVKSRFTDKMLVKVKDSEGKPAVQFICMENGVQKTKCCLIERLVAEFFLKAPPFENACVKHLNGDVLDNNASNLAWDRIHNNFVTERKKSFLWKDGSKSKEFINADRYVSMPTDNKKSISQNPVQYTPEGVFPLDSIIIHHYFGEGRVIEHIYPNKMIVIFFDGIKKTLICGKQSDKIKEDEKISEKEMNDIDIIPIQHKPLIYSEDGLFPLNSFITHPAFGDGLVVEYIYPNQIKVEFVDEVRCLVCGKQSNEIFVQDDDKIIKKEIDSGTIPLEYENDDNILQYSNKQDDSELEQRFKHIELYVENLKKNTLDGIQYIESYIKKLKIDGVSDGTPKLKSPFHRLKNPAKLIENALKEVPDNQEFSVNYLMKSIRSISPNVNRVTIYNCIQTYLQVCVRYGEFEQVSGTEYRRLNLKRQVDATSANMRTTFFKKIFRT
ncbi:hypothetical protein FACS1894206_06860 [Deltaproteobacteria bacterium]|nr:hypothetical protein FACS1894206_06860 [Deltaproteobacteria bacterium]